MITLKVIVKVIYLLYHSNIQHSQYYDLNQQQKQEN